MRVGDLGSRGSGAGNGNVKRASAATQRYVMPAQELFANTHLFTIVYIVAALVGDFVCLRVCA